MDRSLRVLAALWFGISAVAPAWAQTAVRDAEVAKGIAQVDEGDYDGAIFTLDAAARRLAQDKANANELSQAYLYLGIAYIGKGHESAAKAKFREAIAQIRDLSLSPDKFPPKVIDLFEAARSEARATPAQAPAKKGGGKTLLIVGGVVAAGAGVAVAAGGGGSSSATASTTPSAGTRLDFSGTLPSASGDTYDTYTAVPTKAGTLEARLAWTNGQIQMGAGCQDHDPPYTECSGTFNLTSNTTGVFQAPVTQKAYTVVVYNNSGTRDTYSLTILFP